jgi:hypothetical protein
MRAFAQPTSGAKTLLSISRLGHFPRRPAGGLPALQRYAPCACGGECPRCRGEAAIQPKLAVGELGDVFEQEADRIADQVMRMPDPGSRIASGPGPSAPATVIGQTAAPRVQRQTAQEADVNVLRAALLEQIREAYALTDDQQVRERLGTLRDRVPTMTADQLRAEIPGVQQLARARVQAVRTGRMALQPRAQPSTLDPLVDDADQVIQEDRNHQLFLMIQMITASTSFGGRNIQRLLQEMNTTLNNISWFAASDVGFGAATELTGVSGTPPTAQIEVTLGPSMLVLMNRPTEDMIPVLYHELYHAWDNFRSQARGALPARPNLAEAEMTRQGGMLAGTARAGDIALIPEATSFARSQEGELFARLVEHSALQDPYFAGRGPRTVLTGSGLIMVNNRARVWSVVRESLEQLSVIFGVATARTIALSLVARANSEPLIHPNTRTMFRDLVDEVLPP